MKSAQRRLPVESDLSANRKSLEFFLLDIQDIAIENWTFGKERVYKVMSLSCRSLVESSHDRFLKNTLQQLVDHEVGMGEDVTPELVEAYFGRHGVSLQPFALFDTIDEAIERVLFGSVVLFFDGWNRAIGYEACKIERRSVSEPVSEPVVQGPREGTVEDLDKNLALLRRRIRTAQFKVVFLDAGEVQKTKIAYCYLADVVNPNVLNVFKRRLSGIERHEVPETAFVEDWIQDSAYTPFPQVRYTERTDAAAAALSDGKIVVAVDNSPMLMICPAVLVDFIGTSEDYYIRPLFSTMVRLLRLFAFVAALTLPSIYISLTTFHPELIPTIMLLTVLDTREGIPFPAFFEALIMEVSLELLREAGIRLPRPVGSAVSIVGALVIGQAAIIAKIASPIMVIIVALTGIASFAIPHYEMGIAIRILRFPYMIAAGLLGGFGLMAAFLLTLLHLTCLHALGEPYLASLAPLKLRDLRDIVIRVRLKRFMLSPRSRKLR